MDRIRCDRCGIPIPEPPEDASWEELLCDVCLSQVTGEQKEGEP